MKWKAEYNLWCALFCFITAPISQIPWISVAFGVLNIFSWLAFRSVK